MPSPRLGSYRRKRDFSISPEPFGGDGAGGNRFVVHKHSATADHYDLRLEHDGVLKSWAVPKGPSLDPNDKRLAVETEDHPVDYIDFEGVIPEGEYGGGPMIVWDTGTWAPMEDVETSLKSGAFKFRLAGEKLNGGWMLARLKGKPGEKKTNWLLFKEHDFAADPTTDILVTRPESVKSGRRIEELVAPAEPPPTRAAPLRPRTLKGAVKAPLPVRIEPMLATAAAAPPRDDGWLHEIKFDGYRTLARIEHGAAALITRGGLDWTKRYGGLAAAFAALPCKAAAIDGEVVVPDETGITRFGALQDALADRHTEKLVFYAFDLLHLDGYDLAEVPLAARKDMLARLFAGHTGPRSPLQLSDHIEGDGQALFDRAAELGLEGVVSKRANSTYQPGRSHAWSKAKALKSGDFVIAGYTVSEAAEGLAALAVAEWVDGDLRYCGKVGTGFDADDLAMLFDRLRALAGEGEPLDSAPRDVIWVRPVLTAHVHYGNMTTDGMLRHAIYKGLREAELTAAGPPVERKRLISDADLAQIWVTNPTRKMFGKSGPSKLDIAVYYALAGDFMLPHILGRPVSLVRCPTMKPADCFFQRHPFKGMPDAVETFEMRNSEEEDKNYIAVDGPRGYLALAQFGVVEFHAWGSLLRQPEKVDRVIFDLDPGEGIQWREVVEAAVHVRGQLEALGLIPFVKTSGGRGVHVVVPIRPKLGWKDVHAATGTIAAGLAATAPETFTTVMGAANRRRRIFIDFHRNARGATAAAPYSLRARPHLPASTPLNWADLESIDSPEDLNYSSLPGLLTMSGDPWADINESARDLPAGLRSRK